MPHCNKIVRGKLRLLAATEVIRKFNTDNALADSQASKDAKEQELNKIGLWLLESRDHGEWFQLLMTVYDTIGLAKQLTDAGFIILTLNQSIFILDRESDQQALQERLETFLEQ